MSERSCDLCGWPIEEWQKARAESETMLIFHPGDGIDRAVELISHANPADCRPTLKPVSAGEGVAMAAYENGLKVSPAPPAPGKRPPF